MILEAGSKVLVVHRRLFEGDEARYFIGVVDGYESGIAKVSGFSWTRDSLAGTFVEKHEPRTKIFSIMSGTLIVYILPANVDLKKVRFETENNGSSWLAGESGFKMNLTERGMHHASTRTR